MLAPVRRQHCSAARRGAGGGGGGAGGGHRPQPRRRPALLTPPPAALQQQQGRQPHPECLERASSVRLSTGRECRLRVSRYPEFSYDASSGGGAGSVEPLGGGRLRIRFDPGGLLIPALNWRTAAVFGVPIPPPLNIEIRPSKFEGVLDAATGRLDMEFKSEFLFTVGGLYTAPPLVVATTLTTERSSGEIHSAHGSRLDWGDGSVRLVGVAQVPRVSDAFLDAFLFLPTDALAVMSAVLEFS